MALNKRGEVLTYVLGSVLIAFILGTFIPDINPFHAMKPKPNTYSSDWDRGERRSTPKVAVFEDGKVAVFHEIEESFDKGSEKTVPKLTVMQKVGEFFSNLSFFSFVTIIVVGVLIFATPLGRLLWSRHVWKSAFENTVAGVRDIDDREAYEKATRAIAIHQNKRDKRLVDVVKAKLH